MSNFCILQIKDDVQKNKQEYTKAVDKVRIDRAKYEDTNAKGYFIFFCFTVFIRL